MVQGTTGVPKGKVILISLESMSFTICLCSGVVLTHGNLAIATYSNLHMIEHHGDVSVLGFLPLAHIFEVSTFSTNILTSVHILFQRTMELCIITVGGTIGYGTGEPLRLLEDMQILKPNFFPCVPRVLNRIYQSGMAAASKPGIQGSLFRYAVAVKIAALRKTGQKDHFLWDRLVFSGVRVSGVLATTYVDVSVFRFAKFSAAGWKLPQ